MPRLKLSQLVDERRPLLELKLAVLVGVEKDKIEARLQRPHFIERLALNYLAASLQPSILDRLAGDGGVVRLDFDR